MDTEGSMERVEVGDMLRVDATFADLSGAPSDPTTVILKARKPDGTVFEPPVNHPQPGSGYYYADIILDQPGWWDFEWITTGSLTLVEGTSVYVEQPIIGGV
jgi:hypothetical protein